MAEANTANTFDNTLAGPAQEALVAREMRERKKSASDDQSKEEKESQTDTEKPQSLRQRIMAARRAMDIKQKAKEKIEEKVMAPAKQGTNWLLRWAWATLIPSCGLTLIIINLHVFLKMVFGEKLFCKLGDEWIPKQAQAVGGEVGKTGGRAIGIVEVIVLILLDLIVFFIILGILALIVMIVDFGMASLAEKVKMFIGALTGLGWSGIKDFYNLLKGLL